jgi:hypothetical protein
MPLNSGYSTLSGERHGPVSASEYSRKVGRYHTLAQREPVIITSHGRAETVLISAEEYRRLTCPDRPGHADPLAAEERQSQ